MIKPVSKVKIKLPSWVAVIIEPKSSGWLTIEKPIGEDTTINDILLDFIEAYSGFRQAVFNPDTGLPTEQLNFVLNNHLLTYQEVLHTKLRDNDTVMFVPLYVGG